MVTVSSIISKGIMYNITSLKRFKMLQKVYNRQVISTLLNKIQCFSTVYTQNNESQKTKVVYPEILDESANAFRERKMIKYCKDIEAVPTIEEKIFKINVPRYWGWNPIMFEEKFVYYNSLPNYQYITKTHVIPEKGLPSYYDVMFDTAAIDEHVADIKQEIQDALVFELAQRRRDDMSLSDKNNNEKVDELMTKAIVEKINKIIVTHLFSKYDHLLETEIDYEPRLEAFWLAGGIEPSQTLRKTIGNNKFTTKDENSLTDVHMQYIGAPVLHLRHRLPLKEIIPLSESENTAFDIPSHNYSPYQLGYHDERRRGTIVPGFWAGDPNTFGLISFHERSHFMDRPYDDLDDALIAQALIGSFSWLLSQASYQGFSTYNDITYPLINQAVITNGQIWSFYVYQLNTTTMYSFDLLKNQKRNICWTTDEMKLYDSISDGKVHGFNDEVLKNLIKFYVNIPQERDYNLKPYLGETTQVIADYDHLDKRIWLEKHFKHLIANRRGTQALPELLQWEIIYKIKNKTRPMDKRMEPWSFKISPYLKRMDEAKPKYIPRCLRAEPNRKWLNRRAPTYYP